MHSQDICSVASGNHTISLALESCTNLCSCIPCTTLLIVGEIPFFVPGFRWSHWPCEAMCGLQHFDELHVRVSEPHHYALLELLVMSAISVLNAHFLMELELSMLICMTAVVVPCAPLCGTRTRRMFLIA